MLIVWRFWFREVSFFMDEGLRRGLGSLVRIGFFLFSIEMLRDILVRELVVVCR